MVNILTKESFLKNLLIICLLVASLYCACHSLKKLQRLIRIDSATSKLIAIYGTELNTKAKDFKVSWKAGKGLSFKSGDAFKLSIGAKFKHVIDTWVKSDDPQDGRGYEFGTRRFQMTFKRLCV